MEQETVRGYKAFNSDWTCREFQYEVGKKYIKDDKIAMCKNGFHFCRRLIDCFEFYPFRPEIKIAVVEASGTIIENDNKCCTDQITIIREVEWEEVLRLVNVGTGNTGHGNSGSKNSGNWNSGNWNSGVSNSGTKNSGDWDKTNRSSGCFNTKESKIEMFNKPTDWTFAEWLASYAHEIMSSIAADTTKFIYFENMTEEEQQKHPELKACGGYYRRRTTEEIFKIQQDNWNRLSEEDKAAVMSLPNFDAEIFEEITGIKI